MISDGQGSQANSTSDAAQAAGSTTGKPDAAARASSSVVSVGRSAAAQGTSQAARQLALSKAAAEASPRRISIAPVPPRGQVALLLSRGGSARLMEYLRMRCSETRKSMWIELVAMLRESMDRWVPAKDVAAPSAMRFLHSNVSMHSMDSSSAACAVVLRLAQNADHPSDHACRAMPRMASCDPVVAALMAQLHLYNTLLYMMGDGQPLQLSALALAELIQELVDDTQPDREAVFQRQRAAAQAAQQKQAAEAERAAEQRRGSPAQLRPRIVEQQHTQAPEATQAAQQPASPPASPQRAAKRTLKAYRQQRDDLQPPPQGLADKPMLLEPVLRALAPCLAACLKRPGLLDALDRYGSTALSHSSAPHLYILHVPRIEGSSWGPFTATAA